jgi:hypothetical protein
MTERKFDKELCYSHYYDMENGNDIDTICYHSLINIITELCDRIEQLEKRLDTQEEYNQEKNEN